MLLSRKTQNDFLSYVHMHFDPINPFIVYNKQHKIAISSKKSIDFVEA